MSRFFGRQLPQQWALLSTTALLLHATADTRQISNIQQQQQQNQDDHNVLDDDCPWCVAMRSGPCGKQFNVWQQCVKAVHSSVTSSLSSLSLPIEQVKPALDRRAALVCADQFRRLHRCIHSSQKNREYYKQLIPSKEDDDADDDEDDDED